MRRLLLSALWVVCVLLPVAEVEAQKLPPDKKLPTFEPLQHGEAIDLDRVIPANERGILALAVDPEGRVYGGTTGRAAHLFVYDPAKKEVRDLVRLEGGVGFAYALIRLPDGSLIGGTQADPTGIATATDDKQVGWLYRFTVGKDGKAKTDKLGQPVAGQGIYTLAYDEKTQTVMGNTWPDGHFFTYDIKAGKFTDHGAIAGYRPYETPEYAKELMKGTKKKIKFARQVSRAIEVEPKSSTAYTGGKDGYIFQYDLQTRKLRKTDVRLPAMPGREPWASLDVVCGSLWGTSEGYLFTATFVHGKTTEVEINGNVGRPSAQGKFHGLLFLQDVTEQSIDGEKTHLEYAGVIGNKEGMPRSFGTTLRFTGLVSNSISLGNIPSVNGQLSMVGFGAMVKDTKGNIYAGEQDRIARLIRFPTKAPANPFKPPAPPTPPKDLDGPPPEQGLDNQLKGKVTFAPLGTTTEGSGYTALAVGLDGTIYVGAARYGGYARLLRFNPNQQGYFMEQVVDVEDLCGEHLVGINTQGKIHAIILIGPDGRVWFATKQAHEIFDTRPEYGEDPDGGYPGGHLCVYDPKTGFARSMGILKKHEGIMAGAMDAKRNKLYYRSEPKNNFLVFDMKTNRVQDRGHMGNLCRYFAMDRDGAVYAPGRGNYLCRYDPTTNYVEDLLIEVDGPGYYSAPYVIEVGPNGKLYGAGISHPWIMEFDIANYQKGAFPKVKMRNVAPSAPRGMPALDIHAGVFGKDGKFYYPLGTVGPVTKGGKAVNHLRIMRFDPAAGKTETVGIPDTSDLDESKVKHAYVRDEKYKLQYIQGAKVGADGTLYLMAIYPQLNVVQFPKLTAPKK